MAYLYGASIQGIQGFIFETNKLKEIVGASDLVERFCSSPFLKKFGKSHKISIADKDILREAGGNIRIIFNEKSDVEKIVKYFPQYVMRQAYGITLSQAVVEFDEDYNEQKEVLERQLIHARNQASLPLDSHFAIMKQAPRTGKPVYRHAKGDPYDQGSWQKRKNSENGRENILLGKLDLQNLYEKFPLKMEAISNAENKVAVIHADGNKMGLMLQQLSRKLEGEKSGEVQKVFKEVSEYISKATNEAVKDAFHAVFETDTETIPFRPIVIGGDDVTVICDAGYAIAFTQRYLEKFEANTRENFSTLVRRYKLDEFSDGLTACAGIAYCNHKFPFHYAAELAESLCGYAKEASGREASCLAYHNIQSSFVLDYRQFIDDELTTRDGVTLLYAPYYIHRQTSSRPTVDALLELYKVMNGEDIPLGKFRAWLSELHQNREYADLLLERIDTVLRAKIGAKRHQEIEEALRALHGDLSLTRLVDREGKTPMADLLQLKAAGGVR